MCFLFVLGYRLNIGIYRNVIPVKTMRTLLFGSMHVDASISPYARTTCTSICVAFVFVSQYTAVFLKRFKTV